VIGLSAAVKKHKGFCRLIITLPVFCFLLGYEPLGLSVLSRLLADQSPADQNATDQNTTDQFAGKRGDVGLIAVVQSPHDEKTTAPGSVGFDLADSESAAPGKRYIPKSITVYRSENFILHTDLDEQEALRRLDRLERILKGIANYFGDPLRHKVHCYLVADLRNFSPEKFPDASAYMYIKSIGGATTNEKLKSKPNKQRYKAVIYALTTPGVLEHEMVHAYCIEMFGNKGPDWYKEGMAELGNFWCDDGHLECPAEVLTSLRLNPPGTMNDIISQGEHTDNLFSRIDRYQSNLNAGKVATWTAEDKQTVHAARAKIHRYWALCHFMSHHPRYARRFRALGIGLLSGQQVTFKRAFASLDDQLKFEFQMFLDQMENGYRVECCNWQWDSHPKILRVGESSTRNVHANFGYQATGCRLQEGKTYKILAAGTWQTIAGGEELHASGNAEGWGRLVAVVMHDYKLSEPFDLDDQGIFVAPTGGQLYLRCYDRWNALDDNRGRIKVTISLDHQSK